MNTENTTMTDLTMSQFASKDDLIAAQAARIAELEAELEAVGAGGVQRLAAAPQAVQAAVPEAIEQMAVDRYKVVPSHESMFHRWAVVAGNGTQQLYIGREVECLNMARKFAGAFLDGAFVAMQNTTPAHPAEGVPAQDAEAKIEELLALARIMVRAALDADNKTQVQEIKAAIESEVAFERAVRAALAATQPAAQGMEEEAQRNADIGAAVMRACKELPEGAEIQIYLERGAGTVNMTDWDGNEFDHFDQDHEDFACRINAAIDGAIAADQAASQAKQGEQANG